MKKVFIIHGWDGRPDKGWLKWLKEELIKKGFEVFSPEMPDKENPKINLWVNYLAEIVKNPDKDTYFIGHSIGCQTIMRYLEIIDKKIGGVVFVAGLLNLKGLETEEEKKIANPWLNRPINFQKVRNNLGKSVALFSDDDPYVPLSDSELFKQKFGAKIIIEKNKGHYIEKETKQIPVLLNELLKILA